MNKKALEQKDNVKYLGVLIDQHLKWNYHISNISKKISRGVGILSKLRNFMDTDLLKTIYYCLVYSHVSYGIHAWGSACNSESEKINILIKKAARLEIDIFKYMVNHQDHSPLLSHYTRS